jgi:hypothetical protein
MSEVIMLKKIWIPMALGLGLILSASGCIGEKTTAASIAAKCAEAMGGDGLIKGVRTMRIEMIYPDHDAAVILHEIRRPNQIRTERPGDYIAVFDGKNGAVLKFDPKNPSAPPVRQDIPEQAVAGLETDLVWFFPAFFDYPAESAGWAESGGAKCHRLIVTLPHGTRAEYLVDARTFLVKKIILEETYQGQTYRMEREWLDLKPVQGILFPSRMSYPGRGGQTFLAEIKSIVFNREIGEERFKASADIE